MAEENVNSNEEAFEIRRLRMLEQSHLRMMNAQEEMMQGMAAILARLNVNEAKVPNNNNNTHEGPREDRSFRVEVESFDGVLDPEKFIEWEQSLERYFEFKDVDDERQMYKIAKVKMIKYAETWLKGLQRKREMAGKERINTWGRLKEKLRTRFVPSNYKQTLYVKWSTLQQRGIKAEEYIKEFEKLFILCEIGENEELKIGRLLSGLDKEILDKVELHPNLSYDEYCKIIIKYDQQVKRRRNPNATDFKAKRPFNKEDHTPSFIPKRPTMAEPPRQDKGKGLAKSGEFVDIVCFKCHGRGHYKRDCPNPRGAAKEESNGWERTHQHLGPIQRKA